MYCEIKFLASGDGSNDLPASEIGMAVFTSKESSPHVFSEELFTSDALWPVLLFLSGIWKMELSVSGKFISLGHESVWFWYKRSSERKISGSNQKISCPGDCAAEKAEFRHRRPLGCHSCLAATVTWQTYGAGTGHNTFHHPFPKQVGFVCLRPLFVVRLSPLLSGSRLLFLYSLSLSNGGERAVSDQITSDHPSQSSLVGRVIGRAHAWLSWQLALDSQPFCHEGVSGTRSSIFRGSQPMARSPFLLVWSPETQAPFRSISFSSFLMSVIPTGADTSWFLPDEPGLSSHWTGGVKCISVTSANLKAI